MEKLVTKLDTNLGAVLREQLDDNFEKIQRGVDGQSDSLNKQILSMLGDVAPQDQNEVTQARVDVNGKSYDTLKGREDATQATAEAALSEERDTSVEVKNARTDTNSKTYASIKERLDNQENSLNNNINDKLSQISAVPETFANLAALQSKYPTGKTGIFVTADNGHKYIWSNNSWLDAGVYQAVGIADGSITNDKFAKEKDIFKSLTIIPNKYIATSGATVSYIDSPNYYVVKIPITSKGTLKIPMINTGGEYLTATYSDGTTPIWQKTFNELTTDFSRYGFSVTSKEITVDLNKVGHQLEEKFLYVSQAYANQDSFYVNLSQETTTENLLQSTDTTNIVNQSIEELSDSYNPLSVKLNYRQRNVSYDTTTGIVNSVVSNNHATYILSNLPTNGSMIFEKSTSESGQFMIFTDENDKAIINFGYQYAIGERSTSFLSIKNDKTYFNFENALKSYPTLAKIQLTLFQDEIFNFKPVFYNTTTLNEVFAWANGDNNGDLTLTQNYPVLTGKTANVVLDNLLLGESVYDGQTVMATKQLGTQKIGIINETDTSISVNKLNQSEKTINVKRQDPTKNSGTKNVMLIGESTTETQSLLNPINERLTNDATTFNLVGTRVRNNIHHEARSGWGAGALHYVQSANDIVNSFYNPAKSEFDWAWYLTENNITPPDVVVINFGLNDVNRYVDNGTTLSQTEHYNFFIEQIRSVKADTAIIIGLTHIYSSFGNYRHDIRRSRIATLLRQTINDFDNRESENIFTAPYFYNIDSLWDMQYQQIPLNDYQPTDKVDYEGLDAIHPSDIGYKKMADVMYASIKQTL